MTKSKHLNFFLAIKPEGDSNYFTTLYNVIDWIQRKNHSVCSSEKYLGKISNKFKQSSQIKSVNTINDVNDKSISYYLSLGGDGTLIGLCRNIKTQTPIIGINLGKLGFITEFSSNEIFDALEKIHSTESSVSMHQIPRLEVTVTRDGTEAFQCKFINDVVISKSHIARMFELSIESNGNSIFNLAGDGVIFSTPIGSTAYSLAAGGPIVHPEVGGIIITPICPHGLTNRPLVIGDTNIITSKILHRNENISLTVDGQKNFPIKFGDIISIQKKNNDAISFLRNPNKDYFFTLKEKFFLSRRNT